MSFVCVLTTEVQSPSLVFGNEIGSYNGAVSRWRESKSLLDFRANTYSQNGEDGVIKEILRRIGLDNDGNRWCVEFGAWDGKHLSNTFLLVESHKWNAIYIEGDAEKFRALQETARVISKISPVPSMVGGGGREVALLLMNCLRQQIAQKITICCQ